jgi:hypothetical protein
MEMAQGCALCSGVFWVLASSFVLGAVGGMAYGTGFQFNALSSKKSRSFFMMGVLLFVGVPTSKIASSTPAHHICLLSV